MVMKFIGSALIIWGLKQQEKMPNSVEKCWKYNCPKATAFPFTILFIRTLKLNFGVDLVANIAMTTVEKETLIERIK